MIAAALYISGVTPTEAASMKLPASLVHPSAVDAGEAGEGACAAA
jgi:hypothetical protein